MFRSVVILATFAAVVTGCAATPNAPQPCALDLGASYTSTVVPNGRPQVDTLEGFLGECSSASDKRWTATCESEVLTFVCADAWITYRVLDASSDGYIVRIASRDGALVASLVEGDTTKAAE